MDEREDARAMLGPEQAEKVAKIFGRFDEDKDGALRRVSEYIFCCAVHVQSDSCNRWGAKVLVPHFGHVAVKIA
jgi:hypothetical protein